MASPIRAAARQRPAHHFACAGRRGRSSGIVRHCKLGGGSPVASGAHAGGCVGAGVISRLGYSCARRERGKIRIDACAVGCSARPQGRTGMCAKLEWQPEGWRYRCFVLTIVPLSGCVFLIFYFSTFPQSASTKFSKSYSQVYTNSTARTYPFRARLFPVEQCRSRLCPSMCCATSLGLSSGQTRNGFGLYLEPDSKSDQQLSQGILNPSGG